MSLGRPQLLFPERVGCEGTGASAPRGRRVRKEFSHGTRVRRESGRGQEGYRGMSNKMVGARWGWGEPGEWSSGAAEPSRAMAWLPAKVNAGCTHPRRAAIVRVQTGFAVASGARRVSRLEAGSGKARRWPTMAEVSRGTNTAAQEGGDQGDIAGRSEQWRWDDDAASR
jgi:hypothetical protein